METRVGEPAALFARHRHSLLAVALRIVGSRERAEDVLQDVFVKLVEGGLPDDVRHPLAFLIQVVRNLALDRVRRAGFEQALFDEADAGLDVPCPGGTPEFAATDRQSLARIERALSNLPVRTQRAFELHRLEGLTQRDVALALDVSAALVNFMIRDALAACRAALDEGVT